MKRYGLIGHPLKHSMSRHLFNEKFEYEGLDCLYQHFDLKSLDELHEVMEKYPDLCGFNVTIPYKEAIIPLMDEIDDVAKEVEAVNVVKITDGKLKGYNTDVYGFEQLLNRAIKDRQIEHALVLGTGGASKAVQYVLKKKNIPYSTVSRSIEKGDFTYDTLTDDILRQNHLIINTTPVGMFPQIDNFPDLHYQGLSKKHILIDLIYNPKETAFMELGKTWGAKVFGAKVEECVVFEDALTGLEAGMRAGMFTIGFPTTNAREVIEGKCSVVVDSFKELDYDEVVKLKRNFISNSDLN